MIKIKKTCTGCMACMNICPVHAIHQTLNVYGFVMPEIDSARCIHCGKCESVCPMVEAKADTEIKIPLKAYAMVHRLDDVVKISSSGGAFYALASLILEQGGIVFGCFYDIRRKKAYLADTDHVDLKDLLTSKYVESYIGFGFKRVKAQLETGRKVLFCGTPCQAAGLVYFLKGSYENLLIVDFTCGAVAAQTYLRDYLVKLEQKYKSKITKLSFRDKYYGWGQYCFLVHFKNGRIYRKTAMADPYFFCFLRSSMQRLSCHGCRFSDRHFSDVVLADFWKCDDFAMNQNRNRDGDGDQKRNRNQSGDRSRNGDRNRDRSRNGDRSRDGNRNGDRSRNRDRNWNRDKNRNKDKRRGISLTLAMTGKGVRALEAAGERMVVDVLDVNEASYNLQRRRCLKAKLPEIFAHQACASVYGVEVLRRKLLSPKQRCYFALRQFIMDHPMLAKGFPNIVGNGQIMKK